MEVSKDGPWELEMGSVGGDSFQKLLDSQRDLFHSQVDKLQSIVVRQCKLTGANPLSQEMAAGALSVKIGKRPRDLLNPKAVKYMQSMFSIKDAISKKESREISALFGITVTQVRDFFASQRTRVRKFVRLSKEKAIKSDGPVQPLDGPPINSVPAIPFDPVPLNCVVPSNIEEAPSCSTRDEALPDVDESDKQFVNNIFNLMRKEETFSGQVKLMEWILEMQNSSVLSWFLSKGGVMILATWLSQAATEEQTSVLFVVLKVLCHLPLHKAVPVHMSAILQSVNRLRFYRMQDVSNRARVLLSRWSKMFARSQAMKKSNAIKSTIDAHNELLLKQSIGEVMGDELLQSKADLSEKIPAPSYKGSENLRKLESPQGLKLLPAPSDDLNRKHIRSVSTIHNRERRKVQLVEQPGPKAPGKSVPVARAVPVSQRRPMSADDIQKAKMRALFMRSKHGKIASASSGSCEVKTEGLSKPCSSQSGITLSTNKAEVEPINEEERKSPTLPSDVSEQHEAPIKHIQCLDPAEPLWVKCKRVQVPWHTPPEIKMDVLWRVGAGESSKEVEVQKNRICREKEVIYNNVQDIPLEPREPWDCEMDYDDSLTLEIPTDQPPDADGSEPSVSPREPVDGAVTSSAGSSQTGSTLNTLEPDLELLAVLLKNPQLVFSLTSGQAGGLSSEETVRLLDMIKSGVLCPPENPPNGFSARAEEKVEVSLPSPTPSSSNPTTSEWRPAVAKNPFSQREWTANGVAYGSSVAAPAMENPPHMNNVIPLQPHSSTTNITLPQFPAMAQQPLPSRGSSLLHQGNNLTDYQILQHPASEMVPNMNGFPVAHSNQMPATNVNPASVLHTIERLHNPYPHLPSKSQMQQAVLPEPSPVVRYQLTNQFEKPGHMPELWNRQGLGLHSASQANDHIYNMAVRGPVQSPAAAGPWEEDDYTYGSKADYGTWRREDSPSRSPIYSTGRDFSQGTRIDSGRYRPDRSRQRNPSGFRDQGWHEERRWRDRDRERDWRRR